MNAIHLSKMIIAKAKNQANNQILYYRDNAMAKWIGISWGEFTSYVQKAAQALVALQVKEGDTIGICSQNKPQAVIADFANFANRAVSVPMYATASASQIEYIVNDAKIAILFVGDQQQYDNVSQIIGNSKYLKHVVVFDENVNLKGEPKAIYFADFLKLDQANAHANVVKKRTEESSEQDLAIIMYTSGTTGEPKGVMLLHESLVECIRLHEERFNKIGKNETSIAFLPLSHIFERAWTYFCLYSDIKVYLNLRPTEIQQTVKEVRPTLMCSVPRFWEKVAAGVQDKIAGFSPFMKGIVTWAIATGKSYNIDCRRIQKRASFWLWLRYQIADRLIFAKLKKVIGIENGKMFPSAGAAMDDTLIIFFRSLGVPIFYGYGLTETTATVSCYNYHNYKFGSVGVVMPTVQVKIGEDNEILIKGKTVTAGYYNKPEATKESFIDGWFRTGDSGKIDMDGNIYLIDRIKDLFKTSNGKYIAPQQIETKMGADKYVDQIAVIGNNRNFVTAIIAPNLDTLKAYADREGIVYSSIEELLASEQVQKLFEERIALGQADMASFEKIKKFRLIKRGFSLEAGEITSTLKLRRAIILQNYKSLIDEMYEEAPSHLLI